MPMASTAHAYSIARINNAANVEFFYVTDRVRFGIARFVRLSVCPMAQLPRLQARWLPAA